MTLSLRNISAGYSGLRVLHNVSLTVEQGEIHVLLGRNGAGKTTTLRSIFGLVPECVGEIVLDDATLRGKATDRHSIQHHNCRCQNSRRRSD
jgi:branched-chain amino acid transport system ATP-binding protein